MIIFLYGPDDYRRAEKKRWFIEEFKKRRSNLGLGYFDLEGEGEQDAAGALAALVEFARSQSIFDPAKLAVLEHAFELEPNKLAKFLKPLLDEKNTTILISEREKPVKALAFLLEKPALTQKFENLEGVEWPAFIKSEAKKIGIKLADGAAQFLGTVYAGNSWALVTELQKLSALAAKAPAKIIGEKDLDALDLEAAPNYWALLNGMKGYDVRTRLSALETLFALNDPTPRIFNILAAQTGSRTPRMAEYDIAVKSGRIEYEEALLGVALDG